MELEPQPNAVARMPTLVTQDLLYAAKPPLVHVTKENASYEGKRLHYDLKHIRL
jgi:DNA gyrase/topoisomerase IV subunit B